MKRLLALVISIFFISACSSAIEKPANNGITFSNTATSVTPTKAFPMRPDYDPRYQPHTNSITKTTKTGTQRTNRT